MADGLNLPVPPEAQSALSTAPSEQGHPWWWQLGWVLPQVREARIHNLQQEADMQRGLRFLQAVKAMQGGGDTGGAQMMPQSAPNQAQSVVSANLPAAPTLPGPQTMSTPAWSQGPQMTPVSSVTTNDPAAGGTFTPSHPALANNTPAGLMEFLASRGYSPSANANPSAPGAPGWLAKHPEGSAPTTEAPPPGTQITEGPPPGGTGLPTSAPSPTATASATARKSGNGLSPGEEISMHFGPIAYSMRGQEHSVDTAAQQQEWMNTWADKYGDLLPQMKPADAMRAAAVYATQRTKFAPSTGTMAGLSSMTKDETSSKPATTAQARFFADHANDPDANAKWDKHETDMAAAKAAAREAATTTATTRTMQETAPKVLRIVQRIEKDLKTVETGPYASRLQAFMSGKIGAPNPAFTGYQYDVGLLNTALMRMHSGRGGEYLLHHFQGMMDSSTQSAPNMRAALDRIRQYADDVKGGKFKLGDMPPGLEQTAPTTGGTTASGNTWKVLP